MYSLHVQWQFGGYETIHGKILGINFSFCNKSVTFGQMESSIWLNVLYSIRVKLTLGRSTISLNNPGSWKSLCLCQQTMESVFIGTYLWREVCFSVVLSKNWRWAILSTSPKMTQYIYRGSNVLRCAAAVSICMCADHLRSTCKPAKSFFRITEDRRI